MHGRGRIIARRARNRSKGGERLLRAGRDTRPSSGSVPVVAAQNHRTRRCRTSPVIALLAAFRSALVPPGEMLPLELVQVIDATDGSGALDARQAVARYPREPRASLRGAQGRGMDRRAPAARGVRGRAWASQACPTALSRNKGSAGRPGSRSSASTDALPGHRARMRAQPHRDERSRRLPRRLAAPSRTTDGEVVFLGTPAEEGGGGKIKMIEGGVFEGIDAAMMFHPFDRDILAASGAGEHRGSR